VVLNGNNMINEPKSECAYNMSCKHHRRAIRVWVNYMHCRYIRVTLTFSFKTVLLDV